MTCVYDSITDWIGGRPLVGPLGGAQRMVVILPDAGQRYLCTDLYA